MCEPRIYGVGSGDGVRVHFRPALPIDLNIDLVKYTIQDTDRGDDDDWNLICKAIA